MEITKKYNKLWIIDGSYLLHRNLKVPEIWELRSKTTGLRTGGVYGFLNSLNHELSRIDAPIVVIWDSGLSPRRVAVYNDYKRNKEKTRDRLLRNCNDEKEVEEKLKELENLEPGSIEEIRSSIYQIMNSQKYEEYLERNDDDYPLQYHRQRDILISILNSLGIPSIKISDWEGDDLITIISRMCELAFIMTDDKDMIQLSSPSIDIVRPLHKDVVHYGDYLRDNDYQSMREFIILKAITGDSSDNIPSVTSECERKYSLGATRGKKVAKMIYESGENPEIYLKQLEDTGKNYYKGFIEHHNDFLRNMQLVDLSLVDNDEDVVNTIVSEIERRVGKCNFMNAVSLIGEQDITTFDVNGFISKSNLLSTLLQYK